MVESAAAGRDSLALFGSRIALQHVSEMCTLGRVSTNTQRVKIFNQKPQKIAFDELPLSRAVSRCHNVYIQIKIIGYEANWHVSAKRTIAKRIKCKLDDTFQR